MEEKPDGPEVEEESDRDDGENVEDKTGEQNTTPLEVQSALPGAVPVMPGALQSSGNGQHFKQKPRHRLDDHLDTAMGASTGSSPLLLRHERLHGYIYKLTSPGCGFVRSQLFDGELTFKSESIMLECQNYDFKEGEGVEFDVQPDERGRPHAVALKPIVGRKATDCLGQRHRGYVRRFADRWGFLNAAAFDGDLFVHRDNLLISPDQLQDGQPPLRQGQAVEFDVALDDRGRTVAKQITTTVLLRPCDWIGRRMTGYIRSFQGAWGFINCERFAGDLFVHRDSLLPQFQGVDLATGTLCEFDVERDYHKKGGKNRLVARQVGVLHQPLATASYPALPPQHHMMPHGVSHDPMAHLYGGAMPSPYAAHGLNPQAATFAPVHQPPMYYHAQPMPDPQQIGVGYQPPYPYHDPQYDAAAAAHHQVLHHQALLPPLPQLPQYGAPQQYGQPHGSLGHPPPLSLQPPLAAQPPYGAPPMTAAYGQAPYGQAPYNAGMAAVPTAPLGVPPSMPQVPGADLSDGLPAPDSGMREQVLLHITTHDWEPDQSGQLRVRKGTLVNVSHRAAHGWVYAATVQHGEQAGEAPSEGWVPQAVAKRVSLCRVAADWPAEGSGTLGLLKGDLIAVSKEAERGWVYGERVSPKRPDWQIDGWLPKKVLEYILV